MTATPPPNYPRRVTVASQTGTAVRRATPADDERFTDYMDYPARMLRPRSVVDWDGGFTTSTADRVLQDIG